MTPPTELNDVLLLFCDPEDAAELRFLGVERPGRVHAGWTTPTDAAKVRSKVAALAKDSQGVYFTPQRLKPDVLARSARGHFGNVGRVKGGGTKPKLTHDDDVSERRYLIIDVDPIRPAGLERYSATGAEKEAAVELAESVRVRFRSFNWPDPLVIDSGNGCHLYYRLPMAMGGGAVDPANDEIARSLRVVASGMDTPAATIDRRVYNSSRIMKLPGTVARKGPDLPDRPHRVSRVVTVPPTWRP